MIDTSSITGKKHGRKKRVKRREVSDVLEDTSVPRVTKARDLKPLSRVHTNPKCNVTLRHNGGGMNETSSITGRKHGRKDG